ncbi:MAG: hypothetical protein ACREJR_08645 [Candidatus Rokuibacteriota bacterium]
MNDDLAAQLPALLPRAIAWAQGTADLALAVGAPLPEPWQAQARGVGVIEPAQIRIVSLSGPIPMPRDPELRAAARQAGLLNPDMMGLTLGYAILIRTGAGVRVLRHECRHVAQYERAGGLEAFLPLYLGQLVSLGYRNAPFELDAAACEAADRPLE